LVASHIKPWRASTNTERLDPFNGLALTPNIDRTFDTGLITFDEDGLIRLSPLLSSPKELGITTNLKIILPQESISYMTFHRIEVFRAK
jgi:predicted restriction endonuclease